MNAEFAARIARIEEKKRLTQPPMPMPSLASEPRDAAPDRAAFRSGRADGAPKVGAGKMILLCAVMLLGLPITAVGGLYAYAQIALPSDVLGSAQAALQATSEDGAQTGTVPGVVRD